LIQTKPWPKQRFGHGGHLSDSNVLAAGFRRICHRASIDNLRFHDLRHEATSRFFEKGRLSDMEIMKITGHTEYSTLERYVKLRPSVLAAKMD
jgi:integrase